ncbi:MAG: mycothione reductase [Acidipropionibacterium acidipropionici]|jgi:mycothione reductase|uniref:Mycothione reductase n=1 Tax=Acidipropionibacterium acidipropionici (strain ATCC 4875 / DSM 20272 / JCM 6432 / NBRC 12425 / NCIMB 8070 / 4) TaxID=1171373 RepID=K7RVV9_ACIA4|nr:mycothione reductase [Acidipropionibacterium acidipropionici]AFV90551.1 Mycothione reductase [Acidipropionibacterium acidipropionici ATCC 4875]ALN15243.1 mycothione reductase [Acidipropionibacterium acidipropionici]APZ09008.1 mycothione reductase [Acidipropionibacterium acidipropionici]
MASEDRSSPERFDVVVIGSGSGNTVFGKEFADLKVALVDSGTFAGTCLNKGCIPSKMFVRPADLAAAVDEAARIGVDLQFNGASFPAIRDRIFSRIDPISAEQLAFRQGLENTTVFTEEASFVDPHTLQVGRRRITADQIVLAAGSRPRVPELLGIDDPRWSHRIHTSDTIMRIDDLPERIVILGGGFIAAEFAHVFSALGSKVTVINRSGRMLRREDIDVSKRFTEQLAWRASLRMSEDLVALEEDAGGHLVVVTVDPYGIDYMYPADIVLNATGRIPNSDRLNLPAAGVDVDDNGFVVVDEHQRTSVPHIWALGDICFPGLLKHVANAEARVVRHNLLNPDALISSDHRFVPHAVFSDPQVASVGATEQTLRQSDTPYVSFTQQYADVAYGWAMEDTSHFVKLLGDPSTRTLLGAHIIGPQAATLIQVAIQAMSFGQKVDDVARGQYWIHPALPEVVENALLGLAKEMDRA